MHRASLCAALAAARAAAAPAPPPLSSIAGEPLAFDAAIPRDPPAISNFWGSVGSETTDVLSLSQLLLPPFLDVGVPTARVTAGSARAPPAQCTPDTQGPFGLDGTPATTETFSLRSATAALRTYDVRCTTPDCTSWTTATATVAAPFNASIDIVFDELPPHAPFSDHGTFSASCATIRWAKSGGAWSARGGNPVEGWQWTPTGLLRWGGAASSETRMLFEGNGVLQRLTLRAGDAAPLVNASVELTGAMSAHPRALGWTTAFSHSTAGHACSLVALGAARAPGLLSCDGASAACAVWVVAAAEGAPFEWSLPRRDTAAAVFGAIPPGGAVTVSLALVVAADAAAALALAAGLADGGGFAAAWDGFADGWESRWADAFAPKSAARGAGAGAGHFSGSLPVLDFEATSGGAALERLYYVSVFTVLAHERTNLPLLYPRAYVTGTGNQYAGYAIGGTMQFAWDQSFYPTLQALLDPAAARADLAAWIGQPISKFFGIELDDMRMGGDFYAFNAVSLFRAFSAYARVTNDTAFLASGAAAYLETLADFYLPFARPGSTLADYSGDANNYLECVPSYAHATAGLQGGNALMALDLAELRAAQGNASGAAALRARAAAIAAETVDRMFVSRTAGAANGSAPGDVGGWWRVIDTSAGGKGTAEVRHVIDFNYAAMGLCSPRWPAACALNASVAAQMADFAARQLVVPGGAWMRALSPLDAAAPIARPDHGSTGAYDAWPALAFDALTALGGGFAASLPFLEAVAASAREGPFGQAKAIGPDGASVFKTSDGWTRYLANNGGAFAESIVTRVFGFDPAWGGPSGGARPLLPGAPRGVRGTLSCVRDAGGGYFTATLDESGVVYAPDGACAA